MLMEIRFCQLVENPQGIHLIVLPGVQLPVLWIEILRYQHRRLQILQHPHRHNRLLNLLMAKDVGVTSANAKERSIWMWMTETNITKVDEVRG
jgi:hypothetical protein